MLIGIPTETYAGEKRVAMTPETAVHVMKLGHSICVQSGAGEGREGDGKRRRKGESDAPRYDTRRGLRDPPSKGDRTRKGAGNNGCNDGKGKAKRDRPAGWHSNWSLTIGSQEVCTRYHLTSCNHTACRYSHRCPQKIRPGGVCRGNHKVANCTRSEEEKLPKRSTY